MCGLRGAVEYAALLEAAKKAATAPGPSEAVTCLRAAIRPASLKSFTKTPGHANPRVMQVLDEAHHCKDNHPYATVRLAW